MPDFLQSRRERFLEKLLESSAHQSNFTLDESTIQQIRTGRRRDSENAIAQVAFANRSGDQAAAAEAAARFREIQDQNIGTPATPQRADDYMNAIFHNPLDDFLLTQYHMQLSIVDVRDTEPTRDNIDQAIPPGHGPGWGDYQRSPPIQTGAAQRTENFRRGGGTQSRGAPRLTREQLLLRKSKVIAWTGSATNAEVPDNDQLPTLFGIRNLNFITYNAPSAENPHTATTAEASMVLLEPYTFSFDQVLSDVAADLGYEGVSSSRVIFRIDIWFSGWAEDGTYHSKIGISNPFSSHTSTTGSDDENVFTLFMHLIRVNAKVNRGNSELTLNFVPVMYTTIMAPAEYLAVPGDGLIFPPNATLRTVLDRVETTLDTRVGNWLVQPVGDDGRPNGEPIPIQKYTYEIECPPGIGGDIVFPNNAPDAEAIQNMFHGQTMVNVISMLVRNTETARLGLAPSSYPRVLWTVRVVADYGESTANDFLSDFVGIKIKFIIEPFYDFRYIPASNSEARDAKGERLAALISGMGIRRVYWYDHFGLNTEVIRFDQDLNNFYFKNIVDLDFNVSFGANARSNQSNTDIQEARPGNVGRANLSTQGGLDANQTTRVAEALGVRVARRNGVGAYRRSATGPLGNTPNNTINGANGTTQTGDDRAALYENEFRNLVNTDLIQLNNMEVRGDPRWLFGLTTRRWENGEEQPIPIGELRSDCIMVNVMTPKASAYMTPDHKYDVPMNSDDNRAYDLTGFYQIQAVEHTFDGGMYTQKFTGSRIMIDPTDPNVDAAEEAGEAETQQRLQEEQQRRESTRTSITNEEYFLWPGGA